LTGFFGWILFSDGDVTRKFRSIPVGYASGYAESPQAGGKRKETKYLLITHSFPHSPQVFPQEFSTGKKDCGYSLLVHIIRCDAIRENSHFFAGGGFHHGAVFVQKLGLDRTKQKDAAVNCRFAQEFPTLHISMAIQNQNLSPDTILKFFEKRG